jgi:molybdopterin/thiamine biosynthesis adenylyltransferase
VKSSAPFSLDALDRRLSRRAFKVIGLGGIGSVVAQAMAQFLASRRVKGHLYFIDGDRFEEANRSRVLFESYENKAVSKAAELSALLNGAMTIVPVPQYLTPRSARRLIQERDVVFLSVDNHATRKTVSNRCRKLRDVLLISGGNDGIENGRSGTFGNVMVYLRSRGRDRTNPLTRFHPEIAHPKDKRPDQQGCAELAQTTAPQLLFTNLAVASLMLGAFHAWLTGKLDYEEVFLEVAAARTTPVNRLRHDGMVNRPEVLQGRTRGSSSI